MIARNKNIHRHSKKTELFLSFVFYLLSLRRGYTSVEIIVMLSIIAMVGVLTLVSFTGLGERGTLNRAAQTLALNIRGAQNKALGVTRVGTVTPSAISIFFTDEGSSYFIFSDVDNSRTYTPMADVKIGNDEVFERNVRVDSLTGFPSGSPHSFAAANITLANPEASAILTDGAGNSTGNQLDIRLITPANGLTKTITVRTSGQ